MPRIERNRILLLASILVAISPAWAGDLDPPDGLVLHSLATGNNEDGIDATNSIIQSNSAPSNTGVGIDPDGNSTIIENNQ